MSLNIPSRPRAYCVIRQRFVLAAATMLLLAGDLSAGGADNAPAGSGILYAVANAPVAPDGNVAERTTDLVLTLDVPLDPDEPGLTLHRGDRFTVTLPEAFEKHEELPLLSIFDCIPQYPRCDTVVPLLGWPQGALGAPPPAGYQLSWESSHTVVVTATEDLPAAPPSSPGLKQVHLLLNSFSNPPAGEYRVHVELVAGEQVRRGSGRVRVLPEPRPFIAVTNAFHERFANGDLQLTAPGSLVDLPFDFLIWNREGDPLEGVAIDERRLVRDGEVVGRISIDAPEGAKGQEIFTRRASAATEAPVTGIPAGHMRAFFRAGSEPGKYVVTVDLDEGNVARMIARVEK